MKDHDDILETAARLIEEPCLLDMAGILTRTKKGQREFEIREKATMSERSRCAELIRAMMSGKGLDPITTLRQIADLPADSLKHNLYLVSAWPLAWKGWLNIECTVICNSNSSPPETKYTIKLTDEGRSILAHG